MSLIAPLLSSWLRLTEKPHLARAAPEKLRSSFEIKAKLFFWPPYGTRYSRRDLHHDGHTVPALDVRAGAPGEGPLILYFHGGGYVFGTPDTHKAMLAWLSRYSGLPACLPKYRLAPDHRFPAPVEDALTAYQAVADHPGGVVLGGDSAGGGLALALLGEITRQNLPQPLGCFAFSPLTDLSFSGASVKANARSEVVLPASRAAEMTREYLGDADPKDPRATPLHADFGGACPVWLTAGTTEILLDDTRRMAEHLAAQGVDVTSRIEDNLPHVWPLFQPFLPEAGRTLKQLAGWIKALSPRTGES